MSKFADQQNTEWDISLDAYEIMRVREQADPQFLLNDNEQSNTADRLREDPTMLCRVLYVLCEEQRKQRAIDERTFYKNVIGGAIDRATDALIEAIVFFIPQRTKTLYEIVNKQEEVRQTAIERAATLVRDPATMANINARIDAEINRALMRAPSASSSPVTSESIPGN